jgi:antitoxin ParD1/3/4
VPEEVTGIDTLGHSPYPQDVNVSLTPELERMVNDHVRSGMYQTASEVVREALPILKDRDSQVSLRRDVQEGFAQIDRGEYEECDETTIKNLVTDIEARGKARLALRTGRNNIDRQDQQDGRRPSRG